MNIYTRAIETANRLLKKYGQPITLKSETVGTYDINTGISPITETIQNCIGAVFEWGAPTGNYPSGGETVIDGTIIRVGDQNLMLSPKTIEGNNIIPPKIGDIALFGGIMYTIVDPIKLLQPAGILVLIQCNIRGIK